MSASDFSVQNRSNRSRSIYLAQNTEVFPEYLEEIRFKNKPLNSMTVIPNVFSMFLIPPDFSHDWEQTRSLSLRKSSSDGFGFEDLSLEIRILFYIELRVAFYVEENSSTESFTSISASVGRCVISADLATLRQWVKNVPKHNELSPCKCT